MAIDLLDNQDGIARDANEQQAHELAALLDSGSRAVLIFPGSLHTLLVEQPYAVDIPDVEWSVDEPDTVQQIHQLFSDAGADVAVTNTAQATKPMLDSLEIRVSQDRIIRSACHEAFSCGCPFVVGSVGPCGLPTGEWVRDESGATEARMRSELAYEEAFRLLLREGVHGLLIEGMTDHMDAMRALAAARRVTPYSVIVSMVFGDDGLTARKLAMEEVFASFAEKGADALGVEGIGVEAAASLAPRIAAAAREVGLRVLVRPRDLASPCRPEEFARAAHAFHVNSIGLVGAGEGASPSAVGVLADTLFLA